MKDVRSPYYLIICLLFVLSSGILSCTINKTKTNTINQEVNKQEMETKYQAVWEQALKNQDFITIDSLISKNRRFILPDGCHSQYTTIKDDENSTPLENMVYWCIDENCELWFNIWNRSEVLKSLQATRNYLTFNDDSIFGSNITNLGGYLDDSFNGNVEDCSGDYNQLPAKRTNEEERIKTIQNADVKINLLKQQIKDLTEQCKSNLKIIEYACNKGYLFKRGVILYLIFSTKADWQVNEIATVFFYEKLYKRSDCFIDSTDINESTPTSILISYISSGNKDMVKYLFSKNIDKKSFFEAVFPDIKEDDLGPDDSRPSYEAEKELFALMPEEMKKHSGHNLLHTAIVNLDILKVKELIRKDKGLLTESTNPIHPYNKDMYSDKALTPLELAFFSLKKWEKELKEYPDLSYNLFKVQQIKKIIVFLQQELGIITNNDMTSSVPPARPKRYWSALADDE